MDDIGVQGEASEVEAVPRIQVQLAKLNDLYVELGRYFFTTNQMTTLDLEHIKNAIRRLNAIKKKTSICLQPSISS